MAKFRCVCCGWVGPQVEVLDAPNPFAEDDDELMMGCPNCREANNMRRACDEPGCPLEAGNGTPTKDGSYDGYKWSCFEHRPH